jgi:hypothetical protein
MEGNRNARFDSISGANAIGLLPLSPVKPTSDLLLNPAKPTTKFFRCRTCWFTFVRECFVRGDKLMTSIHPGVTGRSVEPLLVRPRDAWRMLGCGNTRGYELLAAGELVSFLDGRSRKVTVESIHRYIARKLASAAPAGMPTEATPQPRRRGRPRKAQLSPNVPV